MFGIAKTQCCKIQTYHICFRIKHAILVVKSDLGNSIASNVQLIKERSQS